MSFERSYSIESHERIKLILIFGDKSLLLMWWVPNFNFSWKFQAHKFWSVETSPLNGILETLDKLSCAYVMNKLAYQITSHLIIITLRFIGEASCRKTSILHNFRNIAPLLIRTERSHLVLKSGATGTMWNTETRASDSNAGELESSLDVY